MAEVIAREEILIEADDSPTLKKLYSNLMHRLSQDIPAERVSTVGRKIILEKKRKILISQNSSQEEIDNASVGRWWGKVAEAEGFINPKYSHPNDAQLHQGNSSLSEYEKENSQYINIILDTKEFLDVALKKLKHNHFMSLLGEDSKTEISIHDWKAQLQIATSFFNHKEKIPVNTQHMMLHAIGTTSSNNEAALEYFKLRTESQKITGKQLSKYRSGEIKNELAIFNPTNRFTAIQWNYFGVKCNKCKSWKIELVSFGHKNKVRCMACENTFETDSIPRCNYSAFPFFEDELKYVRQNENKCPSCDATLSKYTIDGIESL